MHTLVIGAGAHRHRRLPLSQAPAGALAGILVADFSRVLAGPVRHDAARPTSARRSSRSSAPAAATTPAPGDRRAPPTATATYFQSVNRNKRSRGARPAATPAGPRTRRALRRRADVLVENFRPGTMERFGLGYDELRSDEPRLVYCSITGFGAGRGRGAARLRPARAGGRRADEHHRRRGPTSRTKVGVALVDVITGLHATVGILAALRQRRRAAGPAASRSTC